MKPTPKKYTADQIEAIIDTVKHYYAEGAGEIPEWLSIQMNGITLSVTARILDAGDVVYNSQRLITIPNEFEINVFIESLEDAIEKEIIKCRKATSNL